mmetsp:Transcript_5455/g.19725  ORF Transcript_5455/g.19725 Transcript_5455/m.19725 type:complete len:234 (+) Transcript_5455:1396-2097(+)
MCIATTSNPPYDASRDRRFKMTASAIESTPPESDIPTAGHAGDCRRRADVDGSSSAEAFDDASSSSSSPSGRFGGGRRHRGLRDRSSPRGSPARSRTNASTVAYNACDAIVASVAASGVNSLRSNISSPSACCFPSMSCKHRSVVFRNFASKLACCACVAMRASSRANATRRRGIVLDFPWRNGMRRNTCSGVVSAASQPRSTHRSATSTAIASAAATRASRSGAFRWTWRVN